jgi:hypothetical protein
VVQLLDPSGDLFGGRIIAQGADRLDQMVPDKAKRLMQVQQAESSRRGSISVRPALLAACHSSHILPCAIDFSAGQHDALCCQHVLNNNVSNSVL